MALIVVGALSLVSQKQEEQKTVKISDRGLASAKFKHHNNLFKLLS